MDRRVLEAIREEVEEGWLKVWDVVPFAEGVDRDSSDVWSSVKAE
jgi:hypothetical protein